MEVADVLLTIAEIAVAIAGFSSLATVLWSRPGTKIKLDTYRFEGMLINSLLAIAFALLPVLLLHLETPENLVWRLASGLLAAVYCGRGFIITIKTWQFKKQGFQVGMAFYLMTLLLLCISVVLAINIVFDLQSLAGAFYLIGVCGVLTNACVLFLMVFLTIIRQIGDAVEAEGNP